MAKFNEEMVKAGVMLDGNGLQPSSKGARVRFSGNKRTVIDGPFAETKELVAGYWTLQCKSLSEAIEWFKRCPNPHNEESEIEIRQLFELDWTCRSETSHPEPQPALARPQYRPAASNSIETMSASGTKRTITASASRSASDP